MTHSPTASRGIENTHAGYLSEEQGYHCLGYASKTVRRCISIASSTRSISSHVESANIGVAGPSLRTIVCRARGTLCECFIYRLFTPTHWPLSCCSNQCSFPLSSECCFHSVSNKALRNISYLQGNSMKSASNPAQTLEHGLELIAAVFSLPLALPQPRAYLQYIRYD